MNSAGVPTFNNQDEFCIYLQTSLKDELTELCLDMPAGKARTIIANRVRELEKQIAMLKGAQ